MNDTPRTDAKMFPAWRWDTHTMEYVPNGIGFPAEDARKLERELTAMTEQRDRLAEALRMINSACQGEGWTISELRACCSSHCNEALQSITPN